MEELDKYLEYKKKLEYYKYALFIMGFDCETDCPTLDKEYSLEVQNYFNEQYLNIITSDEYKKVINDLYEKRDLLDDVNKLDIIFELEESHKINKIPKDILLKHYENLDRAFLEWENARKTLNYDKFIIELDELINYYKLFSKYLETNNLKGYDVILDDMEKGYTEKMYDKFFDIIDSELVPFIKLVLNKELEYNKKLDNLKFDISKQKKLTEHISNIMGYNKDVGCIRETIHPFTDWANNKDVRITTNYNENLLFSNIYSVIHEIGHALFQLQMDDKYNNTNIFNKVTCITHESQSRFYENYLGRSYEFITYLYNILKDLFVEEFKDIKVIDLYNYVNRAKRALTRIEADELTYPIHILIRYKIEKAIFNDNLKASEINDLFNKLMKEYLDITPSNMKEGCFQDVHWSSDFGYFPTYAVGSAYGAQILEAMKKDIDVSFDLLNGNFTNINKWLKEKIHQFSATRKNDEIIKYACGEEFDPYKYINYLKNKYKKIYKMEN